MSGPQSHSGRGGEETDSQPPSDRGNIWKHKFRGKDVRMVSEWKRVRTRSKASFDTSAVDPSGPRINQRVVLASLCFSVDIILQRAPDVT